MQFIHSYLGLCMSTGPCGHHDCMLQPEAAQPHPCCRLSIGISRQAQAQWDAPATGLAEDISSGLWDVLSLL